MASQSSLEKLAASLVGELVAFLEEVAPFVHGLNGPILASHRIHLQTWLMSQPVDESTSKPKNVRQVHGAVEKLTEELSRIWVSVLVDDCVLRSHQLRIRLLTVQHHIEVFRRALSDVQEMERHQEVTYCWAHSLLESVDLLSALFVKWSDWRSYIPHPPLSLVDQGAISGASRPVLGVGGPLTVHGYCKLPVVLRPRGGIA